VFSVIAVDFIERFPLAAAFSASWEFHGKIARRFRASFALDRHGHPGAQVFLDHLEDALWLADGAALLNDIQQPAQRRVGIGIEVAGCALVFDAHEYVTRQQPVCDLRQFRRIVFRQPFKQVRPCSSQTPARSASRRSDMRWRDDTGRPGLGEALPCSQRPLSSLSTDSRLAGFSNRSGDRPDCRKQRPPALDFLACSCARAMNPPV